MFHLKDSFLSLLPGLTDKLPVSIHDLHQLHEIYKKNVMLFIILTWKAHNLAKKKTNSTEKRKKVGFCRTRKDGFLQVCPHYLSMKKNKSGGVLIMCNLKYSPPIRHVDFCLIKLLMLSIQPNKLDLPWLMECVSGSVVK